jgi:hypothetical protein
LQNGKRIVPSDETAITHLKLLGILLEQSWAETAWRIKIVKLEKLIQVYSIIIFLILLTILLIKSVLGLFMTPIQKKL